MEIDSSDFIAQGADSAAQWSRETQYFLLSRQQVGGRLLLRKSLKPQFLDDSIPELHLLVPSESIDKYKQSAEWNRLKIETISGL